MTQKKATLDVQQENEVFFEARQDFIDTNQSSISRQLSYMPERYEKLIRRIPTKKVSKLKEFFKSGLALIHEKDVVVELKTLIEDNTSDMHHEKRFNQVKRKQRTD